MASEPAGCVSSHYPSASLIFSFSASTSSGNSLHTLAHSHITQKAYIERAYNGTYIHLQKPLLGCISTNERLLAARGLYMLMYKCSDGSFSPSRQHRHTQTHTQKTICMPQVTMRVTTGLCLLFFYVLFMNY